MLKASYSLLRTIYAHPYNRRNPLFALYRVARWQAHKRLSGEPRAYPFWGTRKIICYPDSQESMWLVYNYIMDWEEFRFIKRYVRQVSVVFDVGANIGVYSLWMSQYTSRGYAFEPDPQNFQRCSYNLASNGLTGVRLERVALSNRAGVLRLSVGKDTENHLLPDDADGESRSVEAMPLDAYCRKQQISAIDFLKIDVEGAELLVLQGAKGMLARGAIGVIQMELTDALKKFGIDRSDVVGLLEEHGYSLYTYKRDELQPVRDQNPQNVYAIADIDGVRDRISKNAKRVS